MAGGFIMRKNTSVKAIVHSNNNNRPDSATNNNNRPESTTKNCCVTFDEPMDFEVEKKKEDLIGKCKDIVPVDIVTVRIFCSPLKVRRIIICFS